MLVISAFSQTFIYLIQGINADVVNKKISPINQTSILTVTRLISSKGLDDIIEFAEICGANNIRYHVYGDYSECSKSDRLRIQEINEKYMETFVGWIDNKLIDFENYNVAYFPTKYREGSPRFLLESLANGLVLITSDMPGCSDKIMNDNGVLIQGAKNAFSWVNGLARDTRVEMQKKSLELYQSKFSNERVFLNSNSFYYLENVDGGNWSACSGKSSWLKKNNISAKSHSYFQKICIVFWVLRRFKRMEIELPVLIHILWKTENSFKVKVYVLINVIYKVGVYYRFKNAKSDIVVDEGVVHIAYNIFLNQSDEFICRYIENVLTELLKSSHSIIHIDTSLVEIHSRLKSEDIGD